MRFRIYLSLKQLHLIIRTVVIKKKIIKRFELNYSRT